MNTIHSIYQAVKGGAILENLIPIGASLPHWEAMLNNYKPDAKPRKRTTRKASGKPTKRSQKTAMENVVAAATLTLVERVNRRDVIPFDGSGPGDDTEGTEASLGLPSPF